MVAFEFHARTCGFPNLQSSKLQAFEVADFKSHFPKWYSFKALEIKRLLSNLLVIVQLVNYLMTVLMGIGYHSTEKCHSLTEDAMN